MAVWSDKTDYTDLIMAAHVNQLASGFGATYNFASDDTVKAMQAAGWVTATRLGSAAVETAKIKDYNVTRAKMAAVSIATRQAGTPAAGNAGFLAIDTAAEQTYVEYSGAWYPILIGTANLADDAVITAKILDANVTFAKLESLPSGELLIGDGSDRPQTQAVTGDVTISNAGVTTIGAGVVEKAMVDDDVLSGYGNTASRPAAAKDGFMYLNSQTMNIERDNGATYDDVAGLLTTTQRTDLTDGGQTTLHIHAIRGVLWTDHSVSAGTDGANAPALPVYSKVANDTDTMTIFRVAHHLTASQGSIQVLLMAANSGTVRPAYLRATHSGIPAAVDTATVDPGANQQYTLTLPLGTATGGPLHSLTLDCYFVGTEAAGTLTVGTITVWEYIAV